MCMDFSRWLRPLFYPLDNPVDYEPDISQCLGAKAGAAGVDPIDYLYDFLLEDGGTRFASSVLLTSQPEWEFCRKCSFTQTR